LPDVFSNERGPEINRERENAIRAQHIAKVKAERRRSAAQATLLGGLALGCGWLIYNNGKLVEKLAAQPVVYAAIQSNGEVIASTHYSELPPVAGQDPITNALWTYIQARDCYGSQSPVRQYYIALAMSDQAVGRQVKNQFSLNNPMAPQLVYGQHNITVQCDVVDPPTPVGDLANNIYFFRFRRWEQGPSSQPGDAEAAPFYSVTVRFQTGVYPEQDPRRAWLDRTTFNSPGVQVIDYPGAKQINVPNRPLQVRR
jgi:hypothetical protein